MATVTPKPRAAEDPAATGVVAAAGGSAGSAVRRSIHRAMDRYFGVPNAEECLPAEQLHKGSAPPSRNRMWRTLNRPAETSFMARAAESAPGRKLPGIAHIIRSAASEEEALRQLQQAGLRERLRFMLPCMLASPLAAALPRQSRDVVEGDIEALSADLVPAQDTEGGGTSAAGPLAEGGEHAEGEAEGVEAAAMAQDASIGADTTFELPEMGLSFASLDGVPGDEAEAVAGAVRGSPAKAGGGVETPQESEEPEIQGRRTPLAGRVHSYHITDVESPNPLEVAGDQRLVRSAASPTDRSDMAAESISESIAGLTLLLGDLGKSLRGDSEVSSEMRAVAAKIASGMFTRDAPPANRYDDAVNDDSTLLGDLTGATLEDTFETVEADFPLASVGPAVAGRYDNAGDDDSALLADLSATFDEDTFDEKLSEAESLAAASSSFQKWSADVGGGGREGRSRVARSISISFLRWCAADDRLSVDSAVADSNTSDQWESQIAGAGSAVVDDADFVARRISIAFDEWVESGAAAEASAEIAAASPPPETGVLIGQRVSAAFQRWCASGGAADLAESHLDTAEEQSDVETSEPGPIRDSIEGASNAEDAEALSHAEESGHQSAAGKPPLNASQTFRGQSLPSAFRKWCKSIDGEIAFRSPVRDHVRASMPQRLPSPGGKPHDRSQMLRELSKSFPAIVAAAAASPAHERSTSSSPSSAVGNETQPSQPSEQQTVGIQDGMEGILDGILLDPVLTVMQDEAGDEPLSAGEVLLLRHYMIKEIIALTRRPIPKITMRQLIHMPSCACIVTSAAHRMTRCQMRIADSLMPGLGVHGNRSLRDYFYSLGHGALSDYSTNQVDQSEMLCGAGPNGGHTGASFRAAVQAADAGEASLQAAPRPQSLDHKRKAVDVAIRLHGSDINKQRDGALVYSRNTEVAAFLTELLEMKVRCVIANGFTCAHNDCNPKTLMEMQAPHFDPMRVLPAGYLRGRTTHSSYKLGCGRDFFNFFGSPNGDDGLPWKATIDHEDGRAARVAYIGGLVVMSTLLEKDSTCALPGTPYRVGVYRLRITWAVGHCCWQQKLAATMKVVHIQSWDQSAAQLTRRQVGMLYNAVAGNDPGSRELGFTKKATGRVMIHCAAGIGRTGNIAYGLSELLCNDIPASPLEKLLWLRRSRPESIQTPEQLVDGIQLSGMILQEVLLRMQYAQAKYTEGQCSSAVPANAV